VDPATALSSPNRGSANDGYFLHPHKARLERLAGGGMAWHPAR
jgi:hypothetical protein